MLYVLATLFLALLGFLYLQTRQFLTVVTHLTKVLSELKAFAMGKLPEDQPNTRQFIQPKDDDFGLGAVIEESDESLRKTESGADEDF